MAYTGPGVSVTEVNTTPATVSGAPRRVAIVGKGSATYNVYNVEVVKGVSGGTDTITGTIVSDVNSVIGCGSLPGLYDYRLTTDYTVVDNTISWAGATTQPTTGDTYYVTYRQNKGTSYYEPMLFTDQSSVEAVYGNKLADGVVSEVSLGSFLAFTNGASEVLCLQQSGDTTQDMEDAIDKLETEEVDVICAPGMCSSTLQNYIFANCKKMSSETEKKERIFITSPVLTTSTVDQIVSTAVSFRNDMVTVIAPATVDIVLTDAICNTDVTTTVPSAFAGCALAGIISSPSNDEAEPLTRKQLLGIDSLSGTKYKESEMNKLGRNGVLVLENINGIIRVRHAVTTSIANVNEQELQVKIIRNQTRKDLRELFEPYIGTKYVTSSTNALLASALDGFCKDKIQNKVYVEYKDIKVSQSTTDARVALISYSFKPVYTLTWETISYSLYF